MTIGIGDVLKELPLSAREKLARDRVVTPKGLAKSYNGDWKRLIDDLTEPQLRKTLKALDEESLRAVVYRAFKFPVANKHEEFTKKGVSKRVRVPSLFLKLLGVDYNDKKVGSETFRELRDRLEELGLEVLDTDSNPLPPDKNPGKNGRVKLKRMFKR